MKLGTLNRLNSFNSFGGQSRSSYWTQQLINASCLFFASDNTDLLNKVAATHLPNQVTGSSDFLTVTGTGLNARYRTPDNATYRTADSDYVFWKSDASESTCDGNRLIAYDFPRILVKYLNVAPYTILWIAILKPGVTVTNGMRDSFDLSIWWDNTESFHGNLKGNRLGYQSVWTAESVVAFPASWLARWECDGLSPVVDSVNGNNMSNVDGTLTTDKDARANKAIQLNGTSAYLSRATIATNNVFSICGRFKADAWVNGANLFADANPATGTDGFAVFYRTSTNVLRFFVGSWNTVAAGSNHIDIAITDTAAWHTFCAMYSKAAGKMYFSIDNGVLQEAAVDYTVISPGSGIEIGKWGTTFFGGKVSKLYYWPVILSPSQITLFENTNL
jgi:hypothetical protein